MDVSDLEIFESVARNGSMSRATSELHTVQSNITARIRTLEEELGVSLFNRTNRGVLLTAAGQRLLPFAWKMSQLVYDARNAVMDAGEPGGVLTIGAMTTSALRLARLSSDYAISYPLVRVTIESGTSQALIEKVLDYKLEGAFVAAPMVAHRELVSLPMFRERMVCITSPRIASLDALRTQREIRPVVFRKGCWYRTMLETLLGSLGGEVAAPLEFGSLAGILECVARDAGITLLPGRVVAHAKDPSRFATHALPDEMAIVDTVFVRRADGYMSNALKVYLEMIAATLSND